MSSTKLFQNLYSHQYITFRYVGTPIECWLPQTYSGQWGQYAESYCFMAQTYWYSDNEQTMISGDTHPDHRISYYQWSGWYFAAAGAVCLLPHILWNFLQSDNKTSAVSICDEILEYQYLKALLLYLFNGRR